MSELRHFGMYYLIAQPLLLWDFHCIYALLHWRRNHGDKIASWLDALATYEVLNSAASVRFDHPDWCFPEVNPDRLMIHAEGLGHPLIDEHRRVCNDFVIGPDRRLLLLGGSNMSGKSTLLRTLGCSILLARCGAPVCAVKLTYPPLSILGSFRVEDSLREGVSLFMAELLRIKEIINLMEGNTEKGLASLFLLDEILHGTNSDERRVAVTLILERLLAMKSLGAISTHDLELVRNPELRRQSYIHHFREELDHDGTEAVMKFDYRLRNGEATSSNALALMTAITGA